MKARWLLPASFVVMTACGEPWPFDLIGEEPTIVGIVTAVDSAQNRLRILVEEDPEVGDPLEFGGAKIWFRVDDGVTILDARGPALERADPSGLGLGLHVEATTTGAIQDSYPQQAWADLIVIVG